jgi:hypothetical protein
VAAPKCWWRGGNVAVVHPFERLRHVARAEGAGPTRLTLAAASALAGLGDDHAGLVTGCRQMVDRHPAVGTLWWLSARLLTADDPDREAWAVAEALENDATPKVVAAELPDDATVVVLGWPELVAPSLHRRADLQVLAVDALGEGGLLADTLADADIDAVGVPEAGLGAAVVEADLVLLEASALGPGGLVAVSGSRAAAAVARHAGVAVWAVAGEGRTLPGPMWNALARRLENAGDPWDAEDEVVPLDMVDVVVGPWGRGSPAEAIVRTDCPVAPELFKGVFAPGTRR